MKYDIIKINEASGNVFYKYYCHIIGVSLTTLYKEIIQRDTIPKPYNQEIKVFYI